MTLTTDNTTELDLSPDRLTLVRLSEEYYRTGDAHHTWTDTGEESRTFYATTSRSLGDEWATIVTGPDDPRGGWRFGSDFTDLGVDVDTHRGWNVRRSHLSPVEETPTPDPDRPLAVGDRVRISETHPAGEPWVGRAGTVQSVSAFTPRTITVETDEGRSGGFREEYLTRLPEEASREASEASLTAEETVTREEVDRLIREAVEAERDRGRTALEEWKQEANRIAVEYAEDNELCGNFEAAMSDIGLLGRAEWHEQHDPEYVVTFRVTVRAGDEYDAKDKATSRVYDLGHGSLYDIITDVEEAEG